MSRTMAPRAARRLVVGALLTTAVVAPAVTDSVRAAGDGNAVDGWNATAGEAAIAACLSPTTTRCTRRGCTRSRTSPSTTR